MNAKTQQTRRDQRTGRLMTALLIATHIATGCERSVSVDRISAKGNASDVFSQEGKRQYDSVSERELASLVRTADLPLLVEFGVEFNCARCERMAPVVNDLREQFDGQATIVRTGFNPSSVVQAKLGLRLCPSYVFYRNGKLVDRCDGPTMYPVLKSKLSRLVSVDVNRANSSSTIVEPLGTSR